MPPLCATPDILNPRLTHRGATLPKQQLFSSVSLGHSKISRNYSVEIISESRPGLFQTADDLLVRQFVRIHTVEDDNVSVFPRTYKTR